MTTPTVRRFPRSMAEAFPDVRACAIERPSRCASLGHAAVKWLSLVGTAVLVVALLTGVL